MREAALAAAARDQSLRARAVAAAIAFLASPAAGYINGAVLPVMATICTPGALTRAAPTVSPGPVTS